MFFDLHSAICITLRDMIKLCLSWRMLRKTIRTLKSLTKSLRYVFCSCAKPNLPPLPWVLVFLWSSTSFSLMSDWFFYQFFGKTVQSMVCASKFSPFERDWLVPFVQLTLLYNLFLADNWLRIFTIYMAKLVSLWFGQEVNRTQIWCSCNLL